MLYKTHVPEILYPPINLKVFEKSKDFDTPIDELLNKQVTKDTIMLTSLNRYERKKNIPLAVKSFVEYLNLEKKASGRAFEKQDAVLVIAGGWDSRVAENVEHDKELRKIVEEHGVEEKVVFLKSISNDERLLLLERTNILLYTPENEHFGIVPVEAMHMGCIVIACNSGGPLESVDHGETGYLITPNEELWGKKIYELLSSEDRDKQLEKMTRAAKERV